MAITSCLSHVTDEKTCSERLHGLSKASQQMRMQVEPDLSLLLSPRLLFVHPSISTWPQRIHSVVSSPLPNSCVQDRKPVKGTWLQEELRQEARHCSLHLTCCVTLGMSQPLSGPEFSCEMAGLGHVLTKGPPCSEVCGCLIMSTAFISVLIREYRRKQAVGK